MSIPRTTTVKHDQLNKWIKSLHTTNKKILSVSVFVFENEVFATILYE